MAGFEVCNIFARTVFPRCSWSIYSSIWENNCDERHPLHYQATEKMEKACTALLKLFDAYSPLKDTAAAAQHSDDELIAYKKAQALQFIARITKRVYEKMQKIFAVLRHKLKNFLPGWNTVCLMLMLQLLSRQFISRNSYPEHDAQGAK